ncbi:MAG: transposase, partial [Euryarchaeota archaeon]|nr:transposase [Euryarchaeota archaeon]
MEIVLTYKMKHDWDVKDLLTAYKRVLQRAIDIIWENTEWKEKTVKRNGYTGKRLIPIFPSSNEFKRDLRNELLKDWNYA